MNDDAKLEQIRHRVDEASARNARRIADRASEARDGAVAFVSEHPIAAVAGGIAVGALAAALLPKRSKREKAAAKAAAKPAAWIGIVAQAGLAIAERSLKSARKAQRAGQRNLEHLGDRVSDGTAGLRGRGHGHHLPVRGSPLSGGSQHSRSTGLVAVPQL